MPDNQDVVKLLPLCGGYYWKETGSLGIGAVYSPEHKVVATCMTSREAQKYSDTMNAPTPREQELEAQNKALWELVYLTDGVCQKIYEELMNVQPHIAQLDKYYRPFIDGHVDIALEHVNIAIAAIQKAKDEK